MASCLTSIVALASLLFCAACGQQRSIPAVTRADSANISTREEMKQDTAFEEPLMTAKEIDATHLLRPRHVVIDTPDPRIILRKLFPGNYYELHYDDELMAVTTWTSKKYPVKQYETWLGHETEPFPIENNNMTYIADTIHVTGADGGQSILVQFSTTIIDYPDMLFSGRFASAQMGLACFTLQGSKWHLQAFSPALGYFGAYRRLPGLTPLGLRPGNMACVLYNGNGGPGSAYFTDIYVFAPMASRYKCVLRQNNAALGNIIYSGWGAKVTTEATHNAMTGLAITIDGTYNERSVLSDMMTTTDLPPEVRATAAKNDSFSFGIVRHYTYHGKGYSKTTTDLRITDYDPDH